MDIVLSIVSFLGFIALTAATGVFVAFEFALSGMERSAVASAAQSGDARSQRLLRAHEHLSFELSGTQLGITITTLATGYLAEPVLAKFFTPLLHLCGLPDSSTNAIALVLALIIATLLSMVYGELVPKNMAITDPVLVGRLVITPIQIFNRIFSWFIRSLNGSANWIVRRCGVEPADELASARSAQELGALVRNSAEAGELDSSQALMLDRSLKFGTHTAEELMTPRSTVEFLDVADTVDDLISLSISSGYSRFPVVEGDLDNTVGVVHVKNAFSVPRSERSRTSVRTLARPVSTVPGSLDADAVLTRVRSAGSQLVLVADEYGGVAGLITIEDLVEEILGEFYDEHDDSDADRDVVRRGAQWEVSGLVRIDDLVDYIDYHAPDGPYETVGGLIMAQLGHIPRVNDVALLPEDTTMSSDECEAGSIHRWCATVLVMDGRRIDRALLQPVSDACADRILQDSRPTKNHTSAEDTPLPPSTPTEREREQKK